MTTLPRLNGARVKAVAGLLKSMQPEKPLNFYGFTNPSGFEIVFSDSYPPLHAKGLTDFFFFAMVHNFGFWHDDGEKYQSPLYGTWGTQNKVKGSDLLWKMLLAAWKKDPESLSPERLATISDGQFADIFSDDNGPIELFNTEMRIRMTRDYGRWFRTRRMVGQSTESIIDYANDHTDPVGTLRNILTHPENGIPGLYEDPFGKKAELLLMALVHRPEEILRTGVATTWLPIVDYHIMRILLRAGCVTLPTEWLRDNTERRMTAPDREEAIRGKCYQAVQLLVELSGRSMAEIDLLLWSARAFCPEMTKPNCAACLLQNVCTKRTDRFQPVRRVTFY